MNVLDLCVALLAVAGALRGWRRGLLGQAFEFGGGLVGLLVGVAVGPRVAAALTERSGVAGALIVVVVVLVGMSVGQVLGHLAGHRSGSLARRARLGGVDAGLGSFFGVAVTLVAYWLLGSLLIAGPLPELARELGRSRLLRAMNRMARPPDILASVQHYLDRSGFPRVLPFQGVAPPVDLPAGSVVRRAARAAGASTVRVVVAACGGDQLGSGWIAAPSTVVTNAHVVAGGDTVTVHDRAGAHAATVVLFDPREDVAIARVDELSGPALDLARRDVDVGTAGATLGYPGASGPRLAAKPAAVRRRFPAAGYDIYSRDRVQRDVLELHARVRQGDSGGPFVLRNGRVAGVVFAASTTDPQVGYALTSAAVADEIRRGARATDPVSTGGCTH